MLTPFVLSLALAASITPAAQAPNAGGPSDPPVRLSLNSDGRYRPGERARVNVRSEEDGYLLVLRTDVDGWVRVLYPADPLDDDFVRGGREIEIRDRGDRESFAVSRHDGSGVVLAVYSSTALDFKPFVRGDHWDYRALDSLRSESDPEAALLSIADGVSGGNHFDYDVTTYTVSDGRSDYNESYAAGYYPPCLGCYSGFGVSLGFGFGRRFGSYYRTGYYDPFYSDPFLYDPACWSYLFCYPGSFYRSWDYGYGYGYGRSYAYGYRPFRFDSWRGGRSFRAPVYFGSRSLASGRNVGRGIFRDVPLGRAAYSTVPAGSRSRYSEPIVARRRSDVATPSAAQRSNTDRSRFAQRSLDDRSRVANRSGSRPDVRSPDAPRVTGRRGPVRDESAYRGGADRGASNGGGYRDRSADRARSSDRSSSADRGGRSYAGSSSDRSGRSSVSRGSDRGGRSSPSAGRSSSGGGGGGRSSPSSGGRSSGGGGGGRRH